MFKTKEELIKEPDEKLIEDYGVYPAGIVKAFQSFAERKEFYKKYKNAPTALQEQHPKIYKKYKQIKSTKNTITFVRYEDWLFDFCFGDI